MSETQLSFGVRLAITLPTILSLISFVLRYLLAKPWQMPEGPMETTGLTRVPAQMTKGLGRSFYWDFFVDSIILAMANGLILMFELQRVEWGVVLLFSGIVVVLFGFVCLEIHLQNGVVLSIFLLIMLFIYELSYFAVFGIALNFFGFVLIPRYIATFPIIFVFILILLAGLSTKRRTSK